MATNRVIILIDMDCFYCQVEEKLNPKLKDKPIAVVQYNQWKGGGIIAVNYPARDEGVTRHMRGNEARKKCPSINLVQVPEVRGKADLTKYRDAGKEVADVLATFTPLLQRASVDEAYLDITEAVEKRLENLNELTAQSLANTFVVGSDLGDFLELVKTNREFSLDNLKLAFGGLICEEIRAEVFKKTGYRCSAGIAHNKILAKLVCSLHKPNKQTILPQDAVLEFFETIPIRKIKSLGGKFGQSLTEDFQITYMGELARIPEKQLAQKYDEKTASFLFNVAKGVDFEAVTTKLVSKSIACCKNFSGITALKDAESIEEWLGKLAEEMSERLDKDLKENNRKAKQIIVSFTQEINKKDVNSSRTHSLNSYESQKIAKIAMEIIKKNCMRSDGSFYVKFMGLNASHFEDVRNVREITSFFQVGQKRQSDSNIFKQATQEIDENIDDLVFYDDSKRVKLEENEKPHPSKSFFAQYFQNETPKTQQVASVPVVEEMAPLLSEEDRQICDECNKSIPISDLQSHQDYHFALQLSKSDKFNPIVTAKIEVKKPKGKRNSKKLEAASSNTSLDGFLKKDEEVDTPCEICNECNKRIRVEEMASHRDYHIARKIHLELNSVRTVEIKSPKKKKEKVVPKNKSLVAFFKSE